MSQEERAKIELPKLWKKVNLYSLHLAYCFVVLVGSLQIPTVEKILTKAFTREFYDVVNGWALIAFLVTASGGGILSYVRAVSFKKIIHVLENDDQPDN